MDGSTTYEVLATRVSYEGRDYLPGDRITVAPEDVAGMAALVEDGTLAPVDGDPADGDPGGATEPGPDRTERLRRAADFAAAHVNPSDGEVWTAGGALRVEVLEQITGLTDVSAAERDAAQSKG